MTRQLWSRDELLGVLHLYSRLPFGQCDHRNPEVIRVAGIIGRSPNAVAFKLGNFAHLDPDLDREGLPNVSEADRALWAEFRAEPESIMLECEQVVARLGIVELPAEDDKDAVVTAAGLEREALIRVRVNQRFFRRLVLARYESTCVVTGLDIPQLLVAGHIVPWAEAREHRLNPRNGLCLNRLHDRAFEVGAIFIDDDLRVRVSPAVQAMDSEPVHDLLLRYEGQPLILRGDVTPGLEFLRRHRERVGV